MKDFPQYMEDLRDYRDNLVRARKKRRQEYIKQLPYKPWFWMAYFFILLLVLPI